MNLFLNLTTRNKLFIGFGLMILLLACVIATAYRSIAAMQASQEMLYNRDFANAVNLLEFRTMNNRVRADLLAMMLLSQRSEQDEWRNDLKQSSENIDNVLQQLAERPHQDETFLGKVKDLKALNDAYIRTRDAQLLPKIDNGKIEDAMSLGLGIQSERYLKMRALAQELGQESKQRAANAVSEGRQKSGESLRLIGAIGIVALSLAAVMAWLLARLIAGPLKEFGEAATRIAAGDLSIDIPVGERMDEVGRLAQAFRGMVENLRKFTLETREGMNVLASSSSEILATTTQVASGSAETATAVSETTSTVEEVRQTVELSSQKAKQVSESAQKTARISQSGRQAVEELIAAMDRIRDQTASAADIIVRLSEQSQVIGEIILTVNDLAEQSNLLAVNAAIEAAKAGEQGKGFTVVAQEIKSLAEQSKQATAQVRAILGDIQKATGAAVMATDLCGKAVETGIQQSDAAGETIRLLVESITEAAQAALQIAASSQQQMAGMDQVALAMENIRQASVQNTAGTRQAETAAQNLHELGLKLKHLVERYKV